MGAPSEIGAPLLMIDLVVYIIYRMTRPREEKERRKQAKREQRIARAERTQAQMEQWKADNTIVSTAIVNTTSKSKQKASVTSSVVRGAVGGALFGGVGMVAGAVTPKKTTVTKDTTVTFAILYASGKRSVETVKVGSKRYNELAKYIA